jgi:hypothetical protein
MTVKHQATITNEKAERRRYVRLEANLAGRLFVPQDGHEAGCRIIDLSPVGAQVASELVPDIGTLVVLYIEGFGRFEAEVSRTEEGRFGARFHCSALKKERLSEQLAVLMNRGGGEEPVLRRHERTEASGFAHFTRANGEAIACEVLDLSLSGVSLKTATKPRIGENVVIGQMSGRVVRHHETGIAIEFASASSPSQKLEPAPMRNRL